MVDTLAGLRESRLETLTKANRLPPNARPCLTRKDEHEFRWQRKMWMCTKCLFRTHNPSSVCQSRRFCKGNNPLAPIFDVDNGHRLWASALAGGGSVMYCSKCWRFATAYPRLLLEKCTTPERKTISSTRYYLINRRHPVSHSRLLLPARVHVNKSSKDYLPSPASVSLSPLAPGGSLGRLD